MGDGLQRCVQRWTGICIIGNERLEKKPEAVHDESASKLSYHPMTREATRGEEGKWDLRIESTRDGILLIGDVWGCLRMF